MEKNFSIKFSYNLNTNLSEKIDQANVDQINAFNSSLEKIQAEIKLIILRKMNDFIEDNSKIITEFAVKTFVDKEKINIESYEAPDQDYSKILDKLDMPKGNI